MNNIIFHAYDVRGIYPDQIDEQKVKRIAGAYVKYVFGSNVRGKTVAVGSDVRLSSPSLKKAVIKGLVSSGVNVIDIGVGPTEMVYFAVGSLNFDGGIQVTASHNPAEYNGMKFVRQGVVPISSETGLADIEKIFESSENLSADKKGNSSEKDMVPHYIDFLAGKFNLTGLQALKIVANNNFGMSGPIAKKVLEKLNAPLELIELNFEPDGSFPKGRPDPLRPENRAEISELILKSKADLGVAWDADGDRCYILDEKANFVEGSLMTAVISKFLLAKNPGEKIVYTPQNIWAIKGSVKEAGGIPIVCRHGHSFIKAKMRDENALFGGEKSGHYYYRDFYFADNGIITFLTFLEVLAATQQKVSQVFKPYVEKYFVSLETNFTVDNIESTIKDICAAFPDVTVDKLDGITLDFGDWRFNVYDSGTEPLLRLNVEAKSSRKLEEGLDKVSMVIKKHTV